MILVWILILVFFGFIKKEDNWLGWFMFCRASYCYSELRNWDQPVNIWHYLPHSQVMVSEEMFEELLRFLRNSKGMTGLNGYVEFRTTRGVIRRNIRRSWLI